MEGQDKGLVDLVASVHQETQVENGSNLDDVATRNKLLGLAKQMVFMLEPPEDLIIKQGFMPNINLALRVLAELKVFRILADMNEETMTASQLAQLTAADELLLVRCLRAACGVNFVDEAGIKTYKANKVTRAIASPGLEAGYQLAFDNQMRPKSLLWEFIKYFRNTEYRNPESATEGPLQIANDCMGWNAFDFWNSDPYPDEAIRFNTFMHAVRGSRPLCADWFPIESCLSDSTSGDEALIVDVGGGHGTDLQAFARRLPHVQGRFILQDRASVLDQVPDSELDKRIIKQPIDFFLSQPAKGAKIYFTHMIFHDWPDKSCRMILERLRDAMKPEYSRVLINDAILPDENCPLIATAFDLTMMAYHCGTERSEGMWRDLIDSVPGLEIVKFWRPPNGEGVVEVVRK